MVTCTKKRYTVVLSAELSHLLEGLNAERTEYLEHQLSDYDYEKGEGCYNGSCEVAFKVKVGLKASLDGLVNMALGHFGQDSVLVIDSECRDASLYYVDGTRERLGYNLYVTPSSEISKRDSYSIFHGTHFTVR